MTETTSRRRTELIQFLIISMGFTWLFWIPDALGKRGVLPDAIRTNLGFFGAWGPLLAALFLVAKEKGLGGIKILLKQGTDYKFAKRWWAVIFLFFPGLIFVAYVISTAAEKVVPPSEAEGLYWFLPFIFFSVLFTGVRCRRSSVGEAITCLGYRQHILPSHPR